jgi:16S rRNA (guanine966-N2)-methyltransferase
MIPLMRIISGASKGRRLARPKGQTIRPTSDRVKESLFNILGEGVRDKVVLDLFAGTGNLGIEALSRGATRVVFVENEGQALGIIQGNLQQCDMTPRSEILPMDVNRAIERLHRKRERFDLIMMDPPYRQGFLQATLEHLEVYPIHHEDSLVIIEHDRREGFPESLKAWKLLRDRTFGDTRISFVTPLWPPPSIGTEESRILRLL